MRNSVFEVRPIAGALGAEVHGVDLAEINDEEFADVHKAFLDHSVIFFRDQRLMPALQVELAHRFGDIHFHPFVKGLPEQPEVLEIIKREDETKNFGGNWHSDQAFAPRPAMCTILYAKETPSAGGDTLFASGYLAYEALSGGMKKLIAPLRVFNMGDRSGKRNQHLEARSIMRAREPQEDEVTNASHPLVRTHPETGRKSLYISSHSVRFDDMTEEESAPLLNYLQQHFVRPEFTCRFRWEPGSLAIWDNRCTQHHALNDYRGQRRVMHRITIKGDVPV
jgi:alpha-ketoglutarate-dependent taurine dioxygenase